MQNSTTCFSLSSSTCIRRGWKLANTTVRNHCVVVEPESSQRVPERYSEKPPRARLGLGSSSGPLCHSFPSMLHIPGVITRQKCIRNPFSIRRRSPPDKKNNKKTSKCMFQVLFKFFSGDLEERWTFSVLCILLSPKSSNWRNFFSIGLPVSKDDPSFTVVE